MKYLLVYFIDEETRLHRNSENYPREQSYKVTNTKLEQRLTVSWGDVLSTTQ